MTNQALSALSEYGAVAPIIHNRVAYAAAMGLGQTAQEMEPKSPGAAEVADLCCSCKNTCGQTCINVSQKTCILAGVQKSLPQGNLGMAKKALFLEKAMMAPPPPPVPASPALTVIEHRSKKEAKDYGEPLNFRVPPEFGQQFRMVALRQRMKLQ